MSESKEEQELDEPEPNQAILFPLSECSEYPPAIPCTEPDCDFSTPQNTWEMMKKFMEVHVANFHTQKLSCYACGKQFNNKSALRRHEGGHELNFECDICNKKFPRKDTLKNHVMVIHMGLSNARERKVLPCKICNKEYSTKSMKRHMLSHTNERPYMCSVCDKTFTQSAHLKEHSVIHTNKTFPCDICGSSYTQPQTLKRHIRTAHAHTLNPVNAH